ncbi:DUF2975 domain-containing protein [Altererythrobacter sp. MF3-039]|uniref:DUF2975 domain-containing protein n=1 Tax=Altererythrobacter sp. MF3-039 TaxID=3252901 RepID=UPI00390C5C73
MSTAKTDPLLLAGKLITYIGQGLMAIAGVALTIALPLIIFFQDKVQAEWREEMATTADFPTLWLVAILIIAAAVVALVFLFLGRLRAIINTVGEGDPFVPENAERLTFMAWVMLAIQIVAIPAVAIAIYLQKALEGTDASIDAQLDLSGIILVIMLFILARVFRHGTVMREDLEGTV